MKILLVVQVLCIAVGTIFTGSAQANLLREGGEQKDRRTTGSCDVDVYVVGMGWAGAAAVYELEEFNKYAASQSPPGKQICFEAAEMLSFVGGRATAARALSGGFKNPIFDIMKKFFPRSVWNKVRWDSYTAYDRQGQELSKWQVRSTQRQYDKVFDCLYDATDKPKANNIQPATTTHKVL